jgi:hypothetical protein
MENLEKEFVVYPLAYRMKKLGFDKPCFGYFLSDGMFINTKISKQTGSAVSASTWQSAFDWFREKYNCHSHPTKYDETKWWVGYGTWTSPVFDSFYEAQMCWLERIIELAEMVELAKVVEQASNELNKK